MVAGAIAGLLPLRQGLPLAIVLATLGGLILDFVADWALYWNELFVATLVARSMFTRRPRPLELAAAGTLAAAYGGYVASSSSLDEIFWGAKVLFMSLVAAWAIGRLRAGRDEWHGVYGGVVVALAAALVLAVWQRVKGPQGLHELGISYGDRIRQVPDGPLRVFAGFTSAAPFSYFLVVAIFCWLGFVAGGRDGRRVALRTAWVPAAVVAGLLLSLDRTALVGLCVAVALVSVRRLKAQAFGLLVPALALAVAGILALGGAHARDFLLQGFTLKAHSAEQRRVLWKEYWRELSVFGAGAASAGAAYAKVGPARHVPRLWFAGGWETVGYSPQGEPFRWMGTRASIVVARGHHARPAATIRTRVRSFVQPRTLTVRLARQTLLAVRVSADGYLPVAVTIPAGRGAAVLRLATVPSAQSGTASDPNDHRLLGVHVLDTRLSGLPALPARTPAELVYRRAFAGQSDKVAAGRLPVGVVDNQYLSWLFQYGIAGGSLLCVLWLAALSLPLVAAARSAPLTMAAGLVAVFLAVAGVAVNVWEEAPTDLLAGIIIGLFAAHPKLRPDP